MTPERAAARIELSYLALSRDGAEIEIEVQAAVHGETAARRLLAMVALFENGLVTAVESGENARRTLENQHVGRILHPAFAVAPGELTTRRERLGFDLDSLWVPSNLGVAAFLQDPDSLEIHAATARTLGAR